MYKSPKLLTVTMLNKNWKSNTKEPKNTLQCKLRDVFSLRIHNFVSIYFTWVRRLNKYYKNRLTRAGGDSYIVQQFNNHLGPLSSFMFHPCISKRLYLVLSFNKINFSTTSTNGAQRDFWCEFYVLTQMMHRRRSLLSVFKPRGCFVYSV